MTTTQDDRTAILFVSHLQSNSVRKTFQRIRRAAGARSLFWALDASNADLSGHLRNVPLFTFDFDTLAARYDGIFSDSIVPGNAHHIVLHFRDTHPEFDHYWVIEYDVRFSGEWSVLFAAFDDNTADFLSANIRQFDAEPDWHWWSALDHPSVTIPLQERIRSFNPVFRISDGALELIDRCHADGWTGHYEVLLPTLLQKHGFHMEDLGGEGTFVPAHRINRFYTNRRVDLFGRTIEFGTHRFRPPHLLPGLRRNHIYHPVKPLPDVVRYYGEFVRRRFVSSPTDTSTPA